MQQHVLDDGVGALAVLHDLGEVVLQKPGQLIDLGADLVGDRSLLQDIIELVGEFDRQRREIVDEIERVLDLVGDAGGELAERGQLLGLDQAVLRGAQIVQRFGKLARALLDLLEQVDIRDRDHRLIGEGFDGLDLPRREGSRMRLAQDYCADDLAVAQQWHRQQGTRSAESSRSFS